MSAVTLTADMPIQLDTKMDLEIRRGGRPVVVRSIPREMFVDVHERQCDRNHSQTLERIRERHGFCALEAIAIFSCVDFREVASISNTVAHRILYGWIASYHRGLLLGAEGVKAR